MSSFSLGAVIAVSSSVALLSYVPVLRRT